MVPPNGGASRKSTFDVLESGMVTPMPGVKRESIDLEDYFAGPRDMDRHSKLPYFMRMHGSVLPRMILPLLWVSCWATLITCISKFVHNLAVNTLLLTVLGFVVGLALSFRSTTAYERYSDGRKAWATLSVQSRNLARYFWVHVDEREDEELGKDDLLGKLTAINLILAFAVSLKHKLRFEPYAHYPDIASLVGHLDTFAKDAYTPEIEEKKRTGFFKKLGNYLGLSFAASNPRKEIKRATRPLGNLPLEILTYLSCYIEEVTANGTLPKPVVLGQMLTSLAALTDTMSAAERVLTTPLPVGYNILIAQIVLLYVYLLPFQLYGALGWITIPGTIAAAYIILGLHAIGNELENPFGNDVNDLPLDYYCEELRRELDILTSQAPASFSEIMGSKGHENKVLWPLSVSGSGDWKKRNIHDIRNALKVKVVITPDRAETADADETTLGSKKEG
ncbi:Bestrophin, RFP-TM, chloride channel-domain-containing protein [Bisporella sp. PMI_857]|nr:Bestrophin, RFP-TM, chloride channel-domain-containing protein [Bisporella sp. PMI_857]